MDFKKYKKNNIQTKKKIKIVYINGRFFTQKVTGVQRYARELLKSLDHLLLNHLKIIVLCPVNARIDISFKKIEIKKCGILKDHFWEQLELPRYAYNGCLVNLCNTAPIFKFNKIITIHDMGIIVTPHAYSVKFKIWYRFLFKIFSFRVNNVITVSFFSKSEIIKHLGIPERKIHVIYPGIDHFTKKNVDNDLKKFKLRPKKYILAVGSWNINKNFKGIIKSFLILNQYKYKLVIVGGWNNRIFKKMKPEKYEDNILFLNYIEDNELKSLYANAAVFLFPSYYEGFGIPPIEAMKLGCPVIVADKASLPEVCGSAAVYCNPLDSNDIAKKVKIMLESRILQNKKINLGYIQSAKYVWEISAKKLLKVIEEVS